MGKRICGGSGVVIYLVRVSASLAPPGPEHEHSNRLYFRITLRDMQRMRRIVANSTRKKYFRISFSYRLKKDTANTKEVIVRFSAILVEVLKRVGEK